MSLEKVQINALIPTCPTTGMSAINQPPQYRGKVRYNLLMVAGPCLTLQAGDTLEAAWITGSETVNNMGTSSFSVASGKLTSTGGTVFGLKINNILFPVIERGQNFLYSILGQKLDIVSSYASKWDDYQNEYFFEAIYGYYLRPGGVHYPFPIENSTRMPGQTWNHSQNKYVLAPSPATIKQDLLEGPFWFDSNFNSIPRTQNEIATFAADKTATFFCPDPEKGLALYDEKLTGEELQEAIDFFRGNCNG